MNAESIPEGSSKDSSIINLPKPEIGGSVESGEAEIKSENKEDQKDCNDKKENKYDRMRRSGYPEDEIQEEMIYDAADRYERTKYSDEVEKKWSEKYLESPITFFDEENYEMLKNIPQEERLVYLAKVSTFLVVTPDIVDCHFDKFPEDLQAIKIIYEKERGDIYYSNLDRALLSTAALSLYRKFPEMDERYYGFKDLLNLAKRRRIAPRLLLKNYNENQYKKRLEKFGKAAEGFISIIEDPEILEHANFVNKNELLTEDYYEMSEDQKAEFLRNCIDEIQHCLVSDETFNTRFSESEVKEDKDRTIEFMKESDRDRHQSFYNGRHSMIFKTYQPTSVYELDQSRFDLEMDNPYGDEEPDGEYFFCKLLLVILEELKNIESQKDYNVDKVVDLWDKNRNPIFGNVVAELLSKQNSERAASELLKLIKEEKDDKNPLSAILYRLEFGKVGISEEGVNYLERMYDLGEYNNPDFHVSRLTADGEIGIFDEDLKLMKYFHLGDLSTDEKKVQAKIMDFVYETLFYNNPNESHEEKIKREKYLQDFKENYYKIANDKVFEQTGVRLNNLSFKEQGWFVIYYNQSSEEEKGRLKDFVQNYKEEGIKTFLSLESGNEMGNNVLNIGEKLEPEVARLIFFKYNEIINLTERSRGELEELFKNKKEISDEEIDKIVQNLINKAGCVLVNSAKKIEKGEKIKEEDIIKELEEYKTDLILTASVYGGIDKKDGITFEDLKGVEFESMTSGQIISDENFKKDMIELYKNNGYVDVSKNSFNQILKRHSANKNDTESSEHIFQMMEIYSRNYEDRPAFREKLLAEFLGALTKNESNTNFYMYKKDEDVVAFSRFDQLEDEKILAASLNIRNVICNSHIGKIFSDKCIEKEFRNGDIIASCDAFTPAASGHLESGFVGGEVVEDYNKEDEESNNIPALIIKKERGKKYDSQNLSKEELIEEYNKNFKDNKFNKEDRIILKFDSKSPELLNVSENLTNKENYVMTRYFYADKKYKEAYCVFEIGRS